MNSNQRGFWGLVTLAACFLLPVKGEAQNRPYYRQHRVEAQRYLAQGQQNRGAAQQNLQQRQQLEQRLMPNRKQIRQCDLNGVCQAFNKALPQAVSMKMMNAAPNLQISRDLSYKYHVHFFSGKAWRVHDRIVGEKERCYANLDHLVNAMQKTDFAQDVANIALVNPKVQRAIREAGLIAVPGFETHSQVVRSLNSHFSGYGRSSLLQPNATTVWALGYDTGEPRSLSYYLPKSHNDMAQTVCRNISLSQSLVDHIKQNLTGMYDFVR